MKPLPRLLPSLPLLAALSLALSGVAGAIAQDAPRAPEPPGEEPSRAEDAREKLDTYGYDRRDDFAKVVREITAGLDKQIAEIDPAGHAPAPVGRSRAFLDLQSARRILDERVGRIDLAIPENWDLIRDEVLTALAQVRTAYDKAASA